MTDTSKYKLNHTMLRVKDPKLSVQFYEYLGMSLIQKYELPDFKLGLYFLAYDSPATLSHGNHLSDREGVIELSHTYGTENDPDFKYHNGNKEPQGFGHVCVSVDNIQAACNRLLDAGYKFQKKFENGSMRNIAFVLDPDGYWVKIIGHNPVSEIAGVATTNLHTYKMNHTMLRVKDKDASIKYYQDVFGMNLMRVSENKDAGFNLYFLGYGLPSEKANAHSEGLLELTWNYGTESKEVKVYHDGNYEPQGFGHICVSVDDLEAACKRFEEKGVTWQKRLLDGQFRIGFILDPDGYWVEIIQNEKYKPALAHS